MKLGFICSNFPGERRVPLLPQHIQGFENELLVETGFGSMLDIPDSAYEDAGCHICSRDIVFQESDGIFSLKLIQPSDYEKIRPGQMIIGWTHPLGSGKSFMEQQAYPKDLIVVDLDNRFPTIFHQQQQLRTDWIPTNAVYQNSFYAGYAGVLHACLAFGLLPNNRINVAILGSGNVAQGAFHAISKFTSTVRMFYRRTLPEFHTQLSTFDFIINGIEVGDGGQPILTLEDQRQVKPGTFFIDIAADAGNAIEGNHFTSLDTPIYQENGHYYYTVPNTPTLAYRNVSECLSRQFSRYIYQKDISIFKEKLTQAAFNDTST